MELYQRKSPDGSLSPFWYYDITMPDGTRKRRSTKQRIKAKARQVMLKALQEAEEEVAKGPKRSSLGEATLGYVRDLRARHKHATARVAELNFIKVLGGPEWTRGKVHTLSPALPIDALTSPMIEALKDARRSEGSSEGTIAHELKMVRAACIWAERQGAAPAKLRWAVPPGTKKLRALTVEEWRKVYDELEPARPVKLRNGLYGPPAPRLIEDREASRDLLVLLTLTGGRWGEVSRMTVDQVSVGPPVRACLFGWKTKKERMVPMPPFAAEMLVRRVAVAAREGTPYVFPASRLPAKVSPYGRPRVDWRRSSALLRQSMDRAGINAPHIVERQGAATVHSLRHTFATWLRRDGVSLGDIKELLGHESEAMTMRYAHIAPEQAVDAAASLLTGRLGSALGSTVTLTTQKANDDNI